jgi:hypothetical protein
VIAEFEFETILVSESNMMENRNSQNQKRTTKTRATRGGREETLGDYLDYLIPGVSKQTVPTWPPDAFGLTAATLHRSGAYSTIFNGSPVDNKRGTTMRTTGTEWRRNWTDSSGRRTALPANITKWWNIVKDAACSGVPISKVKLNESLADALLSICVCADEASNGVGIPISNPEMPKLSQFERTVSPGLTIGSDPFQLHADMLLLPKSTGSSLCEFIDHSKLRVLPKMHTPQSGLTIRAFSHHLALCMPNEVHCEWHMLPVNTQNFCLNLLLVPWPKVVRPAQFQPAPGPKPTIHHGSHEMFTLHATSFEESDVRRLAAVLKEATAQVGRIDGVVLPELALDDQRHEIVKNVVLDNDSFMVSGVGSPSSDNGVGKNCVALDIPIVGLDFQTNIRQGKHHRWKLNKSQILQYGLSTHLNPAASWWEHISIAERRLAFVAMRPWLVLSVLVCEDLARPDPAGDILRAVGPNLVIAILMDGPQITDRWSARYATILADDPGCSVLCLTSAGMAELSKPRPGGSSRSGAVALWKDPERGLIEIDLSPGADAIVLNISVEYKEEWSIDGRSDGGATGYPILSGIHYITAPKVGSRKVIASDQKPMTTLSPVEASALSVLARHHRISDKDYSKLLRDAELSLPARRLAEELHMNGRARTRSKLKKPSRIVRETAREIRSWADFNQRIATTGPRTNFQRPVFSSDQE